MNFTKLHKIYFQIISDQPSSEVKSSLSKVKVYILFWEEICACEAVHTHYVTDACNRVQSIILLPHMVGTSFVLVVLTRLNVSEPKQSNLIT